jgi:signal transduction histidine kinase
MRRLLKSSPLYTRLMLAYAGLIVVGFSLLTMLAGQQISTSLRLDYEQRVLSEALLMAQGIEQPVKRFIDGQIPESDLITLIQGYEAQIGGQVIIHVAMSNRIAMVSTSPLKFDYREAPELRAVTRGQVVIDWRQDSSGEERMFTAVPIAERRKLLGYAQLSIPWSNLGNILVQRWIVLGLGVVGITAIALFVSVWLSRSLTRPLEKLRISAIEISRGNLAHRVPFERDDEIGEVAKAFNQMADQVKSMLEEQRAFASNASHELRTPLTTIQLRTDALRHEPDLDEEIRARYIIEIDEETKRLSSLVEDLILLSRFDAGRAPLGNERIDLLRFVTNLQRTMTEQAARKNIDVILNIASNDSLFVDANLNHLTVVFRNLLDNALKYTPANGRVIWSVACVEGAAAITIEDNGQGIAAEHLPQIFTRFYRVDKSRSRHVTGTGLGLSLVKAIIEAYGGTIEVSSPGEGQGTVVTVRLKSSNG